MTEQFRSPPHSNEAEQSLLGAVLLVGMSRVQGKLFEDDFYTKTHQLIWRACCELDARNERIDAISVSDWFRSAGEHGQVENGSYLISLANDGPGVTNVQGWIRIIREKADLRRLMQVAADMSDRAMAEEDPAEIIRDLQGKVLDWGASVTAGPKSLTQFAASWLERLGRLMDTERAIDTGLDDLDAILMGLMPQELMILAARPGMGKSSLAMQIAERTSRKHDVLFFSAEMSGESYVKRLVAKDVDARKLRRPSELDDADWHRVRQGIQFLKTSRIHLDDSGGLDIRDLCARARSWKKRHDIRLIVVDYLQLIHARQAARESRQNEVSEISRSLKGLAKLLDVPVIALSQLNRGLEGRPDKRPRLSDLRESGALEQDADMILFIYRESEYEDCGHDIAELILAKHRDAQTGRAAALWRGDQTRFLNLDKREAGDYWASANSDRKTAGNKFQKLMKGEQ